MSLPLADFESTYKEARPKEIISREKLNRHIAKNNDNCLARQLRIDGYVITENIKKCDYLVLNDDKCAAYFIELKGSDITGAIEQIEQTVKKLEKDLRGYDKKLRIVYSGKVISGSIAEWKKKNRNADAKHRILEENI